jgi:hypothetical protein
MLIREIQSNVYSVFMAKVQVQQPNYSQWIDARITAKNMQEARKLLLAQYGPNAKLAGLRKVP